MDQHCRHGSQKSTNFTTSACSVKPPLDVATACMRVYCKGNIGKMLGVPLKGKGKHKCGSGDDAAVRLIGWVGGPKRAIEQ